MFYALVFVTAATADDLTPEKRAKLLKATAEIVTEKIDDFEKKTLVNYTGPDTEFNDGVESTAGAAWKNQDLQVVSFHLHFTREHEGWRWLKSNEAKILVDDERLELEQSRLSTDVMDRGKVYESKFIALTLEQALKITAGDVVRIKVGPDEYVFAAKERLPLQAVLYNWIGRGGDVSAYDHLMKRLARPAEGTAFAEVVKKHGAPVWRDPETGWATWEWFWVRFKNGKVTETRPRPIKEKAAQ